MRYTYVASWSVTDGVGLPEDVDAIELHTTAHSRFIMTRVPDSILEPVDRAVALRTAILRMVTNDGVGDLHGFVDERIHELAEERRVRHETLLVQIAEGEIDIEMDGATVPTDFGYVVQSDAFDKEEISKAHQPEAEAMKTALALENRLRLRAGASEVYLTREDGVVIHSLSMKGEAHLSVKKALSSEARDRVDRRCQAILRERNLDTVRRLFALRVDTESDRLRRFLYGWAALEVFVHKAFKANEMECEALLLHSHHEALQRYRSSQRKAGRDADNKNLAGRFASIAALLFPEAPPVEARADCDCFRESMNARDTFYHGNIGDDAKLPAAEMTALLRKYVGGYLDREMESPGAST